MAKSKAKNAGKGAAIITLLSNPMIRRAVIKGATRAANSTAEFVAARRTKSESASAANPEATQSQTNVVSRPAAKAPAGSAKRPSLSESAAVESIVGSMASVAKPVAERLAASSAGRSVLEAVNSISAQALGTSGPPKRTGGSVANFVGGILAGKVSQKPQPASHKSPEKFTPVKPPSTAPSEPVKTMQWPPPKSSKDPGA